MIGIVERNNSAWVKEFIDACRSLKVNYKIIHLGGSKWRDELRNIKFLIWRFTLSDPGSVKEVKLKMPIIEEMGITCFPNRLATELYDDKLCQVIFMDKYKYPTPHNYVFFSFTDLLNEMNLLSFPIVSKLSNGAGSSNVMLIKSKKELITVAKKQMVDSYSVKLINYFSNKVGLKVSKCLLKEKQRYVYLQQYIPSDGDIRIVTFRNGYFSLFKRINRKNDFRASGSGVWRKLDFNNLPINVIETAFKISKENNFTCMAYDFIIEDNREYLLEMSYGFLLNDVYINNLYKYKTNSIYKSKPIPIGILIINSLLNE